ncbi:integrase core domain-containing protein [Streptomyces sp. ME01-24h]|nr:integrase core domain-containing protein [Streptomyces sp. ME19-03-3]MDX3352811.1 integrase core domain-containing protein [Streptomyces sp. ME01-24h]
MTVLIALTRGWAGGSFDPAAGSAPRSSPATRAPRRCGLLTVGRKIASDPAVNSDRIAYPQGYGIERYRKGQEPPTHDQLISAACKHVRRALKGRTTEQDEKADELRAVENLRLDRLFLVAEGDGVRAGRSGDGDLATRPRANPVQPGELIHHWDAGSQYTSFRLAEHLDAAGVAASIGSVGDAYDNALMESTIGLFKTELIKPRRPWKTLSDVELATAEYVDWYNHRRLHGEVGHVPPIEYENNHYLTTTKPQFTINI